MCEILQKSQWIILGTTISIVYPKGLGRKLFFVGSKTNQEICLEGAIISKIKEKTYIRYHLTYIPNV